MFWASQFKRAMENLEQIWGKSARIIRNLEPTSQAVGAEQEKTEGGFDSDI